MGAINFNDELIRAAEENGYSVQRHVTFNVTCRLDIPVDVHAGMTDSDIERDARDKAFNILGHRVFEDLRGIFGDKVDIITDITL